MRSKRFECVDDEGLTDGRTIKQVGPEASRRRGKGIAVAGVHQELSSTARLAKVKWWVFPPLRDFKLAANWSVMGDFQGGDGNFWRPRLLRQAVRVVRTPFGAKDVLRGRDDHDKSSMRSAKS